jgi:beta-glucosidase
MSFPRYSAQAPIYYNEYSSGRPANASSYSSRYQDCEIGPLFSFGHGLTYTNTEYSNFTISSNKITEDREIKVAFQVRNPSKYDYSEIVILYIEDLVSKMVRPTREMKAYQVVTVPANQTVTVEMIITLEDLKYLNASLQRTIEPGEFKVYMNNLDHPVFTIEF